MARITILGTGAMGSRMATRLLESGHSLCVWNRDASRTKPLFERGAQVSPDPRSAVADAEFVISLVRDEDASRDVWLNEQTGALAALQPMAVAIESSTIRPEWARTLSKSFAEADRALLEAPVIGSRPQAEAGQLIYLAGGEKDTFDQVIPILAHMSSAAHHTGPVGSAGTVKLVVNALLAIQVAGVAELLAALHQSDLDIHRAVEIISSTAVVSPAVKVALGATMASNFNPMFPISLVDKDMRYATDMGHELGVEMPITSAAARVYAEAVQIGFGDDNINGVAKLYLEGKG